LEHFVLGLAQLKMAESVIGKSRKFHFTIVWIYRVQDQFFMCI